MNPFKNWNTTTIIGSAILGAIYGFVSSFSVHGTSISLWEIIIPVVCAGALFGAAGSAIYRLTEGWQLLRDHHHRHSGQTVHYRGRREFSRRLKTVS